MNLILGSGLAGLSASYHLGHEDCLILEKNLHAFGHLHADYREGFTWDQGPHVSFTKHQYVKDLFAEAVGGEFEEYEVKTSNFYKGHWIDHPAQCALYQLPEPLRSNCLASFLESRNYPTHESSPKNYSEWLEKAFGPVFAQTFPSAYTRKYWTRDPSELTTEWVGPRVFQPNVNDVIEGSKGPLGRSTHYITKVRYPRQGGYKSFGQKIALNANINYGHEVNRVDLKERKVWCTNGSSFNYNRLINTLPLPVFVSLCAQATHNELEAATQLSCSQLLLVNVTAPHDTIRQENWMYVYDEDKYSTRINCTEKLATLNAPKHHTGVQVEVYFSRHRPLNQSPTQIADSVVSELVTMGLIDTETASGTQIGKHTVYAPWANVVFDHATRPSLHTIWRWLESYGLARESDDLHPLTDWTNKTDRQLGNLAMAGRFGQWKYYWTDDCVLRGSELAIRARP
jgi:protoporphyrinogen oxidase